MLSIPREALKPTIKRSKINLYRTDILHVDFNRYAEERCFQFKRDLLPDICFLVDYQQQIAG